MLELLSLANRETALVLQFLDVLHQEQEALQSGNVATLSALVGTKTRLVDALNETASERNQLLSRVGLPSDKAGMQAWLQKNPAEKTLQKIWDDLLQKAGEARVLHQQNSKLLTLHIQRTNSALAVLNQKMQNSLLYGPDGQSTSFSGHHIIDSA